MARKLRLFFLRYAGWLTLLGVLSSILMGHFTIKLFSNLKTDLEELLPTHARSVLDLEKIQSRLESTNNLEVIITSQDTAASRKWVDDLVLSLKQTSKEIISSVEYRVKAELLFFQTRSSLFLEVNDLKKIKNYIQDKINYEAQLYNPLTFLGNLSLTEPRLNFDEFQKKYSSKTNIYSTFPDGYYATPDEHIRVVIVNLPNNRGGISAAKLLHEAVDSTILKLNPKKHSADLSIHYSGGVQDLIEEHDAIVEDLVLSTVVVCILVGLSMVIFFKSLAATLVLVASLIIGTLCTFGLGHFLIGYLNSNTAFMASIVIGNGINFGIILLARFTEERRKNKKTPRALLTAIKTTFSATIVAASAAALSYGSLILTGFRGFHQFGELGFFGMIFCWISAYTFMPAMIIVLYRIGLFKKTSAISTGRFSHYLSKVVLSHSKPILVFTVFLTIFSLTLLPRVNSSIIETDLKKLRSSSSIKTGSIHWSKSVDQVFQRYLSPLVVLPVDFQHVLPIKEKIKEIQKQKDSTELIANIYTIHDFVPTHQITKIKLLHEIDEILKPDIRFRLSTKDRQFVSKLLPKNVFHSYSVKDLPELLKIKFREKDGTIGKLILVEPTLSDELTKSQTLIHFVRSIRQAGDQIEPGVPVAGSFPVTSDMFESILKDGPKTTIFAFLAVFFLVILLFREPFTILLCSFTLILGVLWLTGLAIAMGDKINFLNFIALPITFGIGVDYGINIFQRYRTEKIFDIIGVIQNTGGAVILASLTTVIGYASLIIARNQAFVSFGKLAILGELCCVFASVISLPALLHFINPRRGIKNGILSKKQ